MDLSDILEPNDNRNALQQSNCHNTEGLPAHSECETPFAENDPTTEDVDLVGTPPIAPFNSEVEMIDRLRQACASRSPRKPTVTGAGAIFKGSQHTFDNPSGSPEHTADTRSLEIPDPVEEGESDHVKASNSSNYDDASTCVLLSSCFVMTTLDAILRFRQAKKVYKAKCKAGQNTQEDDILFKVADKKEKARLASLEAEYLRARGSVDRYLRFSEQLGEML